MSAAKGAARERELVNRFLDDGWGALRLGASGSGGDADLPDVLAARKPQLFSRDVGAAEVWLALHGLPRHLTECWAVELKSGKATTLYVQAEEVDALRAFARRWGARPFLGARYTTQGSSTDTYLVPPERARGPTDAGAYGLPVSDIDERAVAVVSDSGVTPRD